MASDLGFEKGASGYAEFVCFGYKRGDDGKLVIDEPDAEIVRKMYKMRASGCSLGAISNWLYILHTLEETLLRGVLTAIRLFFFERGEKSLRYGIVMGSP